MSPVHAESFHVAFTADFYQDDGSPKYSSVDLGVLQQEPGVVHFPLPDGRDELEPDQVNGATGVIVLTPKVTERTVSRAENLLAIARFGVGYDRVDVPACTAADVVVFTAKGAVDYSVAEATVGWMIALAHHARIKDKLVREGRWDEREDYMGSELRDRTLGIVGLGGIGQKLVTLVRPFRMRPPIAFDPGVGHERAAELGVRLVELDELLHTADFVSLHVPLTDFTRNMIGERELGLMRRTAYLINMARGEVVDEDALFAALSRRQIAGAAIDVFKDEPLKKPHRFATFENVLLAPHAIAWTHEMFRDIGHSVCRSMLNLATGRHPHGIVNPEVFDHWTFQEKWTRLRLRSAY